MILKVKKLYPDAILPSFARPGDAGMDLFAQNTTVIKAGEKVTIGTGIAMEFPDEYVGLVWEKSGLASVHGLVVLGGVMDAGYRGEYIVSLINLSKEDYILEKGHKVAQVLFQEVEHPEIVETDGLSDSHRGVGRFGSTGK